MNHLKQFFGHPLFIIAYCIAAMISLIVVFKLVMDMPPSLIYCSGKYMSKFRKICKWIQYFTILVLCICGIITCIIAIISKISSLIN